MTTKEQLRQVIETLPESATVADAIERLYLLHKIETGMNQADRGQKISNEEARSRMQRWLE